MYQVIHKYYQNKILFIILQNDWQQRETELLKKIEELEKVKAARSEDGLRLELKVVIH